MQESRYKYQYPENLAAKPKIAWWYINELVIVAVIGFAAVIISLKIDTHDVWIGLIIAAGTALLFARFDDQSIYEILKIMFAYLSSPQVWEYQPGAVWIPEEQKESKEDRKKESKKKKKNRNLPYLILAVFILAVFLFLLYRADVLTVPEGIKDFFQMIRKNLLILTGRK